MCCKKPRNQKGKGKQLDKISTGVSTIKGSAYISLKYVQINRKKIRDLRKHTSKAIDIYHDQDGHNLLESPCKCIVFGQNNNKLRGIRAKSIVYTIERLEEQIQDHA